ncbi:MAG: DNA polymerase III subunit gamma/tau, partial [Clostridia bacterium]|nr:DNA polymerase III subunit gamma/tau [Clostridia bacterium]
SHLALYREFRPKDFTEVVGQEHIVKTLVNQVKTGNLNHAYLFCGTRGTGKTRCAKIFAKAVNCLNSKNGSPCFECESCRAISENGNLDIIEIDAASNNRVDEIR